MNSRGAKPRLLDLFCGAGGAAVGYARAGFDVVGVDVRHQPRYPFEFRQADAMTFPLDGFDVVHASPPCQAYSAMKSRYKAKAYPDLLGPIRDRLIDYGIPYVIENVEGAPMTNRFILCGSMFQLRSPRGYLRRHRQFETNPVITFTPQCQHSGFAIGVYGHGSAGESAQRMRTANASEARQLMGMDWATRDGMSQAIPPAYTEWIGTQLLRALGDAG